MEIETEIHTLEQLQNGCQNISTKGPENVPKGSDHYSSSSLLYAAVWIATLRPLGSDAQPQSILGIHLTAVSAAAFVGK